MYIFITESLNQATWCALQCIRDRPWKNRCTV